MDNIALTELKALLADARTFTNLAWKKARELNEEASQSNETYRQLASRTSAAYDILKRATADLEKLT